MAKKEINPEYLTCPNRQVISRFGDRRSKRKIIGGWTKATVDTNMRQYIFQTHKRQSNDRQPDGGLGIRRLS